MIIWEKILKFGLIVSIEELVFIVIDYSNLEKIVIFFFFMFY